MSGQEAFEIWNDASFGLMALVSMGKFGNEIRETALNNVSSYIVWLKTQRELGNNPSILKDKSFEEMIETYEFLKEHRNEQITEKQFSRFMSEFIPT